MKDTQDESPEDYSEGIKAANAVIKMINKKTKGPAIARNFSDEDIHVDIPRISTGSLILDGVLGGGWAKGRMHEIYGAESSGKTTVCTTTMREYQRAEGLPVLFLDMECAFDAAYAVQMGVVPELVVHVQPESAEDAFDIIIAAMESGIGLIIVDSLAAMIPKAQLEGAMDKATMAIQARVVGKGFTKIIRLIHRTNTTVIFTNQLRDSMSQYEGEYTPGGKAPKFYCSTRIKLASARAGSKLYHDSEGNVVDSGSTKAQKDSGAIGQKIKASSVKNKTSAPFRKAEFTLLFGRGYDRTEEVYQLALAAGIFKQITKVTYEFEGDRITGGKPELQRLMEDDDFAARVAAAVDAASVNGSIVTQSFEPGEEEDED